MELWKTWIRIRIRNFGKRGSGSGLESLGNVDMVRMIDFGKRGSGFDSVTLGNADMDPDQRLWATWIRIQVINFGKR